VASNAYSDSLVKYLAGQRMMTFSTHPLMANYPSPT
jgi:hypothetical protein